MDDPQVRAALEYVPEACRDRFLEIVERLDAFADAYLDEQWKDAFVRMATPLCQKGSPALKGWAKSWAAGIIYSVGRINFLGDPLPEPHMTADQIAEGVGVSKSNMQAKARTIRDGLDLLPMDPDYTVPARLEANPLAWFIEVDGMLIDARRAPRELQEAAAAEGLIPFVPGWPEREGRRTEEAPPEEGPIILRPDFGGAGAGAGRAGAGASQSEASHPDRPETLPGPQPCQEVGPAEPPAGEPPADFGPLVRRYKRLRQVGRELNNRLIETISRDGLKRTAERLGLWHAGTVVFETEDETSVLMDHAIHGYFEEGRNAVDRYVEAHPPEPGSDEAEVLEAARRAFFTLIEAEVVVPDVGVGARDLLGNERFLLVDLGFSQTAAEGDVVATRLLPFEGFVTTSGAALPANTACLRAALEYLEGLEVERDAEGHLRVTRQQAAEAGMAIHRIFLEQGASSFIGYRDPGEETASEPGPLEPLAPRPRRPKPIGGGREKVGRNAPCPCGSGKKYKKCCGRRGQPLPHG